MGRQNSAQLARSRPTALLSPASFRIARTKPEVGKASHDLAYPTLSILKRRQSLTNGESMNRKSCFVLLVAFLLTVSSISAETASGEAVYLSTTMKFSDFVKNVSPVFKQEGSGDGPRRLTFRLPCILVYDPAGVLIYYGSDPKSNGDFLRGLPGSATGHTQTEGLLQRKDVFIAAPDFAKVKDTVLSDHRYLVIAITQFPSHPACLPQDSAVRALRERDGAARVDVLQIALDVKN
jgi:hypothetical protein